MSSPRPLALLVPVLLVGAALVGCNTFTEGVVQRPTGEVLGVRIVEQTADGVRVEATLEVTNPNPVELPIEDASVSFTLADGKRFVSQVAPAVSLPPGGAQRFTVAAAVPKNRSGDTMIGSPYRLRTTLHYRPPGELRDILTESGVGLPSITIGGDGKLGG